MPFGSGLFYRAIDGTTFSRNTQSAKRVDFSYTADSRFDVIDRYANLAGTDLVAATGYTYDDAGRLTNLNHAKGATTFADYNWTFDSAGRMTQQSFTDYLGTTNTSDYSYDDTGQLTAADHDYQADESYTYDANGNRVSAGGDSYTTGDHNRMTTDGTYTYHYDAEGNRTARFIDADSSGTLNTGDTGITEYEWDTRNRLVGVTEYATYGGSATQDVDYVYDLNQRLIKRTIDADGAGAGTATAEHFVYDGNQIVLTFTEDAAGDQLDNRYLWGPQVDQLLAHDAVAANGTSTTTWALIDHLGSARDLVQYDTTLDATSVVGHYIYDAFGQVTSHTGAVTSVFQFTGRYRDSATSLQWNLSRWYDFGNGIWLSEDPIGFDANDTNLARYVGNRPSILRDPFGQIGGEDQFHHAEREERALRRVEKLKAMNWDENVNLNYEQAAFLADCVNEWLLTAQLNAFIPDPDGNTRPQTIRNLKYYMSKKGGSLPPTFSLMLA
jgi:RHS repeat-associated protein